MALSPKAVVLGGVTDLVLSGLLGIPFTIYVMRFQHLLSLPKEQLSQATISAVHGSTILFSIQLVIGLACSVVGGYVAARIARSSFILNGVLAAWLCVGIGVYSMVSGKYQGSPVVHLLLIGITPFAYLVGARLRTSSMREPRA
jgi:hypothetical protein